MHLNGVPAGHFLVSESLRLLDSDYGTQDCERIPKKRFLYVQKCEIYSKAIRANAGPGVR